MESMNRTTSYSMKSPPTDGDREKKLISLNLIFSYPVNWSRYKVLRDFIQNFYDAVGPDEWMDRFTYRLEEGSLVMEASDVSFSYDWLIHIGASTKRDTENQYAGYFGEGFKIASLCALRDHGWEVSMESKDWGLEVVTTRIRVDNSNLKSLAYRVWRKETENPNSILTIRSFSQRDMEIFECAVLSFYYKGNPLIGPEIWSSRAGAIHYRSKIEKPSGYPSTFQYSGEGIIFAAFQALGSHPYNLVFCMHNYRKHDRERSSFYRMDVIDTIKSLINKISPDAAFKVLIVLKNRWYDYHKKRYDFESWYEIVHKLTRIIGDSPEYTEKWKVIFPNLLVAGKVRSNDIPRKNRRSQALAWLRDQSTKYKLVQDGFLRLGYPELEALCEENDGFNLTREPTERELKYIALLEGAVLSLFVDFMNEMTLPPCRVIKNPGGVWVGMTSCIRLSSPEMTPAGHKLRFRLPYIALKSHLFDKKRFGEALSTYLHELAHGFGGDQSRSFSQVVTEFLEIAIIHSNTLEKIRLLWEKIEEAR